MAYSQSPIDLTSDRGRVSVSQSLTINTTNTPPPPPSTSLGIVFNNASQVSAIVFSQDATTKGLVHEPAQ